MLDQARAAGRLRSGWGSWSERAIQPGPIRWGSVAAFALLRLRNARVRAMASLGMARRARMGPTKVNPLRLIGQEPQCRAHHLANRHRDKGPRNVPSSD